MNFSTFSIVKEGALMRVTLSSGEINLLSGQMFQELFMLTGMLRMDPAIKVVLFDSANPDFFIAHADLTELEDSLNDPSKRSRYDDVNALQGLAFTLSNLPQVTIAKIDGNCRGGGFEVAQGLNMIFASENSKFGYPEASGNLIAGGGGATSAIYQAGPKRALEVLLSSRDFSGKEAENYNLINRALPAGELDAYVEDLVERITYRSNDVIAAHKQVVAAAMNYIDLPTFASYEAENEAIKSMVTSDKFNAIKDYHLDAGQTKEVEMDLPKFIHEGLKKLNLENNQ